MVNSNDLHVIQKRLEAYKNQGYSRYHSIIKIEQELTTLDVSQRIRFEYDLINEQIQGLKNSGLKDIGDKVHRLNELKRKVPTKFALTRESLFTLNELINQIVHEEYGVNSSEIDDDEF